MISFKLYGCQNDTRSYDRIMYIFQTKYQQPHRENNTHKDQRTSEKIPVPQQAIEEFSQEIE